MRNLALKHSIFYLGRAGREWVAKIYFKQSCKCRSFQSMLQGLKTRWIISLNPK